MGLFDIWEPEQKEFNVTVKVWGYVTVNVEANSHAEAGKIASEKVSNMDFGPLHDIDWHVKLPELSPEERKELDEATKKNDKNAENSSI